jgi:maltose alpha-D-glucosyltransferase/alpha-amylase
VNRDTAEGWYKDAVVYEVHVKGFQDSNGDGIGDFQGLRSRLPWLRGLGVDCLWLLPFFPSPLRDDGYDISDYMAVHPDYGTLRDFREFLADAHRLGIRVLIELVLNHTSDQHPWFQAARRAPRGSAKREWYVWSDDPRRYEGTRIIFTDTETSNWTWDPVAGQYYWHRFFSHQPDLNFDHPAVRRAVGRVLRFWLDRGVDGVRLDAVPYLVEREGTSCENLPETHAILRDLRRIADGYSPQRIFLAEANQWPQDVAQYFGDGDECHMAFHFPLMPRLFMALAQEDAHPVREILESTPAIPPDCQWAIFLRNHDELTLEMVTDRERDYMYRAYASDPRMRINVGIRRRLAPLVGNSRTRIELLDALLLSLPGTPVLYYGDEIGMGDNIYLGDRNGVRTPMQWSPDRNAGFSSAEFARLYSPPVMDGIYGYQGLNVEAQERDPSSLLHWTRRILSIRSGHRAFGRGGIRFVEGSNRRVLAFLRESGEETLLVVANFSRHPQPVSLQLRDLAGRVPVEMFGGSPFPEIAEEDYPLALSPHGFYWFRLESPRQAAEGIRTGRVPVSRGSFPLLETDRPEGWWEDPAALLRLQEAALPTWLQGRVWLEESDGAFDACSIEEVAHLGGGCAAMVCEVRRRGRPRPTRFGLVLLRTGEDEAESVLRQSPGAVVARTRSGEGSEELLVDALATRRGLALVEESLRSGARSGPFRFECDPDWEAGGGGFRLPEPDMRHPVLLGGGRALKVFHRLRPGLHPGEEVLRHLEAAGFGRVPRVRGGIVHEPSGSRLGILMDRIAHQGKADERFREACLAHLEAPSDDPVDPTVVGMARLLGRRTGELHSALADDRGDRSFAAAPWDGNWQSRTVAEIDRRLDRLGPESPFEAERDRIGSFLASLGRLPDPGSRIRVHGDLHLGQVLWTENDYTFLDFEGEPGSTPEQRRAPQSPSKDLASLRISIHVEALRAASSRPSASVSASTAAALWAERTWEHLRAGYAETAPARILPGPGSEEGLLRLHVLARLVARAETAHVPHPAIPRLVRHLVLGDTGVEG